MKLWHDDVRPPPNDTWLWARTNEDAREILKGGQVTEISLDHDLGYDGPPPGDCEECGRTGKVDSQPCGACDGDGFIGGDVLYIAGTSDDDGYNLARWMCENRILPERITIHSWNPDGAKRMANAFRDVGCRPVVKPYEITA